MMLWEKLRRGCDMRELVDGLETFGVRCKSHRQIETMGEMVMRLWKHSRMICYRGYSPAEISEKIKDKGRH